MTQPVSSLTMTRVNSSALRIVTSPRTTHCGPASQRPLKPSGSPRICHSSSAPAASRPVPKTLASNGTRPSAAPTNWLAVDGLTRYGYTADADRLAGKFMATVESGFRHDGTIREKYNMDSGSSDVNVTTGYKTNVVGFGWTNGVYREMEQLLASKSAAAD